MRRRWLWIALAASMCLNAGFLAAWMIHHAGGHRREAPLDLGLAPDVKRQFDAHFEAFRTHLDALHDGVERERGKLLDLIASPDATPETIREQVQRVAAAMAAMTQAGADQISAQKKLLTPEQQKRFFEHIRRRMQDSGRKPPFMDREKDK